MIELHRPGRSALLPRTTEEWEEMRRNWDPDPSLIAAELARR